MMNASVLMVVLKQMSDLQGRCASWLFECNATTPILFRLRFVRWCLDEFHKLEAMEFSKSHLDDCIRTCLRFISILGPTSASCTSLPVFTKTWCLERGVSTKILSHSLIYEPEGNIIRVVGESHDSFAILFWYRKQEFEDISYTLSERRRKVFEDEMGVLFGNG